MPISLDRRGYITPYKAVPATLGELHSAFVSPFVHSQTRNRIYEGYIGFCREVVSLVGAHQQWVDGSFTGSKLNPGDIDILCFVSTDKLEEKTKAITALKSISKEEYGVDMYVLEVPSKDHPRRRFYEIDRIYWLNQFTKTKKMGHRKIQYDKGFLELYIN